LFLLTSGQSVSQQAGEVVISEFLYKPVDFGDPLEEFLELHNRSGTAVDLDGWCITDGIGFCFGPGDYIAPGEYLVLAKDAVAFEAAYGFAPDFSGYSGKLANSGETLVLEDELGLIVDRVSYEDVHPWPTVADGLGFSLEVIDPAQDNDTPRNWAASVDAAGHTAGAVNSVAATGLPPWISQVQHGSADPSTPIGVSAFVEDATSVDLIYRLGFGSEVSVPMLDDGLSGDGAAGDGTYGAFIPGQPVDTLVRYWIEAIGPTGQMTRPRVDDTIDYLGTVVVDPALASDLPIFHWYIAPADLQAALDHYLTDETEPAVLFYDGRLWDNIEIRVRGGTSRDYPKKSWKFIFPQGNDFIAPGIGIDTPIDRFNLQASYADKSYLREILSWETFEAAGVLSLKTFHVRMQQNGDFFGLYTFLEQPDNEWIERVGLDENAPYYKAVGDNAGAVHADCHADTLANLEQAYEKKAREYEDYSDLQDFLININGLSGQARREYVFDNVDLPIQINYQAALILMHENDAPHKNYYLYRDTEGTGRWFMFPWDKDLTWGRNYDGQVLNDQIWADVDSIAGRTNVTPSHPLFGDQQHQKYDYQWNRCIDAYYAEPDIQVMFFRRLRTLMDELLVYPLHENRIDELVSLIDSNSTGNEAALDAAKWGQYGTPQTLTEAVDIIKNDYLAVRRPHLFGAHRVPGEIPEAQTPGLPIVITEIMYAPAGGTAHEFVELFNPSPSEAVDLSGWTFEGLGLAIPPGTVLVPQGYLVLAYDDAAFRAEYGSGHFVAAEYEDSLPNLGTSIVLRDSSGAEIDRVEYSDSAPWPSAPAGGGPSLELVDPALDNNDPANWAASAGAGGTPGAFNSVSVPGAPPPELYINEVLPSNASVNQDQAGDFDPWIEIYNASPTAVELGGMHLSNNFLEPDLWRFPLGTSLCSGCWLVVWADGEPPEGPLHTNFALNPLGGTIILSDTGLVEMDAVTYGTLASDTSLGRLPDGGITLLELLSPSPGIANRGAAPLILNEYNAVSDTEFLKDGASDIYWGIVAGNGGDWFELLVTVDHLDLRGWQLLVSDDTGGVGETTTLLTLTQHPIWSDLRAGTIITVSENLADDVGYDPTQGDWWINVQAADGASGTYITAQSFSVSNSNTQITILDAGGAAVFGPAGEGIEPVSGVGSTEVFKLEEDPGPHITPLSNYNDGSSSTFGAPNVYSAGTLVQDLTLLRSAVCFSDADCDDANVCNGVETCDMASGTCLPGYCGLSEVVLLDDDFETGFGSWSNVGGDDIDWTRDSGGTPSSGTGPTVDHTTLSSSGFYLYTESSTSGTGYPDMTALLESPCIDLIDTTDATLTFWYHMFGSAMGSLYVDVAAGCGTSWTTEFALSGSQQSAQSDPYLQANVDLSAYAGTSVRLRFRGVTGSNYTSDMAIDDVQVSASVLTCGCDDGVFCNGEESCAGSTCVPGIPVDCEDGISCTVGVCNEATLSCDQLPDDQLCDDGNPCNGAETCDTELGCQPTSCDPEVILIDDDFEAGFGSWTNVGGDVFDWTRDSGGTPSSSTGPSVDHTLGTSSGFYLFTETSSPRSSGDTAILESPCLDLSGSVDAQMTFWYHMYGSSIGTLNADVAANCGAVWTNGFSLSGNQGDQWLQGGVDLTPYVGAPVKLRFVGIRGGSYTGDIAIDDVQVAASMPTCECEDGDVCNGIETCNAGVCEPGTPLDCDDQVACTADLCDAIAGCQNPDTCVGGEACDLGSGLCEPKPCSGDPECDDGLYCNGVETCVSDLCAPGTPVACDDGVACTVDGCDEALDDCEFLPDHAACQNGVFCDGVEFCDPVLDCQPGLAEDCDDAVGCTVDSCNIVSDACDNVPDDGLCDNGLFCDGDELCDPALDCQPGLPRDCDDGVGCTADSCNEVTDGCDNTPDDAPCQNSLFCDGAETCDAVLDCQLGPDPCAGLACDDNIDFCVASGPAPVILNEYNGVASGNFLKDEKSDVFWGRIEGNGGDWFELVVTVDHLDMRGWDLVWSDDGGPGQTLTLSGDSIWSDLRAGTIITVSEDLLDDVGYEPVAGDWWINVQAADGASGTYITASDFEVSNHDWQLFILNASDVVVFGPAGEGINPLDGIGSDEVFKLEEAPGPDITPQSNYNDGTSSSFGAPNIWSAGTVVQDFSALRPNFPGVILNEYNAVVPGNYLGSGNSDPYWGRIAGNGGDWFELVVTKDQQDLRGWELEIVVAGGTPLTLTLSNDPIWSGLRAGTIITVSEDLPDDVSYDPVGGDWWINVQAADDASGSFITASDFEVSNEDCQITIRDASAALVFGPAGEGIYPLSGVGTTEVFKLEEDPSPEITPYSSYNDGDSSTFGSPNVWSGGALAQDFSALRACSGDPDCDDGLFCNGQESCVASKCVRIPIDCGDGVGCTIDSCNEATDTCENVPDDTACWNGLFCDGIETCDAVLDCQPASDPCPGLTCDEVNDICGSCNTSPDCDDGLFCNGQESCVNDVCVRTPLSCDDGVACTVDSCNEATDACENVADQVFCDNGVFCDGVEFCDPVLDCQAGTPEGCDDGVGCTVDSCNGVTDACQNLPDDGLCDDGLFCDGVERCDAALDCLAGANPCIGLFCDDVGDVCVPPPPAPVILNEYNGVSDTDFLKNAGTDSFWGTVQGNGGDWFELVVTIDHQDLRGWQSRAGDSHAEQRSSLGGRAFGHDHHGFGGAAR